MLRGGGGWLIIFLNWCVSASCEAVKWKVVWGFGANKFAVSKEHFEVYLKRNFNCQIKLRS